MSIFATAFSEGVWITLASLLVSGTFALSFVLRRENNLPHAASYAVKVRLQKVRKAGIKADQQRFFELQDRWDLSEILLVAVGAICQQGCTRDPSTSASRILYISLLLMATVVLTAFSAVLTAGVSTQTSTCSTMDKINDGNDSVEPIFYPNGNGVIVKTNSTLCADFSIFSGGLSSEHNGLCSSALRSTPHEHHQALIRRIVKRISSSLVKRKIQQGTAKSTSQSSCQQSDQNETQSEFLSISLTDVWPAVAQLGAGLFIAFVIFVIEIVVGRVCVRSGRTPQETIDG